MVVNYLRVANVQDGYLDLSEISQLKVRAEDVKRYAVLPGDMLMNEGGDLDKLGRGAIWKGEFEPCVHQNHVFVVRCGSRLLSEFLNAWTGSANARRFFMLAGRQTTNLASINKTSLGQFPIPLPPSKEEQKIIAEALSDTDALIESLLLLLTKKRQIKQGVMQELLTGKKRLPGFSDKWDCKRLGEIATIEKGQLIKTESLEPGEVPVIAGGKKPAYFHSRPNRQGTTITVSASGASAGYVALHRSNIFASDCSTISESDKYCIDFLFYALLARQGEIYATQTGGAQPHVQPKDLARLHVSLPRGIDEQTTIAAAISDIDTEIEAAEVRLSKARDIKSGMMQALLTGRIRLVLPSSNVIPLPTKPAENDPPSAQSTHNWQINEAVVIGVLAQRFGNKKFPLPRKRRVKLMYLLHRHAEGRAEGYLKKAAGPYDPNTKYKGPEAIALKNGYVQVLENDKYEGFVAGDKIEQAQRYFEQWYGTAALEWLEQFHYRKTDDLELLATVDMAMVDIAMSGEPVSVAGIKSVIAAHPEWVSKLSRALFSDEHIASAITECQALFND